MTLPIHNLKNYLISFLPPVFRSIARNYGLSTEGSNFFKAKEIFFVSEKKRSLPHLNLFFSQISVEDQKNHHPNLIFDFYRASTVSSYLYDQHSNRLGTLNRCRTPKISNLGTPNLLANFLRSPNGNYVVAKRQNRKLPVFESNYPLAQLLPPTVET